MTGGTSSIAGIGIERSTSQEPSCGHRRSGLLGVMLGGSVAKRRIQLQVDITLGAGCHHLLGRSSGCEPMICPKGDAARSSGWQARSRAARASDVIGRPRRITRTTRNLSHGCRLAARRRPAGRSGRPGRSRGANGFWPRGRCRRRGSSPPRRPVRPAPRR